MKYWFLMTMDRLSWGWNHGRVLRLGRLEVSVNFSGPAFRLVCWDDDHNTFVLGLVILTLYFKVPRLPRIKAHDEPGYGFYFCGDHARVEWGFGAWHFTWPWIWDFYKRWELVEDICTAWNGQDSSALVEVPRRAGHGKLATKHQEDYTYTLKSGEVQKRKATYYVERMEWRWRWLKWSPWPKMVRDSISVDFSDEVGEGSGSWKGGCTGCGYDMKPGETGLQTLRRMEREREFKR